MVLISSLSLRNHPVPPSIITGLRNQTVVYHCNTTSAINITFSCDTYGQPHPSITWLFRGQPLEEFQSIFPFMTMQPGKNQQSSSLTFYNVSKANEGWIECFGKNTVGEISSKAFLKVFGKFEFLKR